MLVTSPLSNKYPHHPLQVQWKKCFIVVAELPTALTALVDEVLPERSFIQDEYVAN